MENTAKITVINNYADTDLVSFSVDIEDKCANMAALHFRLPLSVVNNLLTWEKESFAAKVLAELEQDFASSKMLKLYLQPDRTCIAIWEKMSKEYEDNLKRRLPEIVYSEAKPSDLGYIKIDFFDLALQMNTFSNLCLSKMMADATTMQSEESEELPEKRVTLEEVIEHNLNADALTTQEFKVKLRLRDTRDELRVLVVEDDLATSALVQHQVNTVKQHAIAAKTGQEAIDAYAKTAPNIVFLDIGLPDTSGLDILKILKYVDSKAFIVMLTANTTQKNLRYSISYGAKGFVAKPFTRDKLQQYISKYEKSLSK